MIKNIVFVLFLVWAFFSVRAYFTPAPVFQTGQPIMHTPVCKKKPTARLRRGVRPAKRKD